jgi:polyisoprenoid-binding protein YceI
MKRIVVAGALAAALMTVPACAPPQASKPAEPAAAPAPVKVDAPAGEYKLDKLHASLLFRVNHIGFSNYTGRFSTWDASLQLDPAAPEKSRVVATIDPRSLGLENPPPGFLDTLKGKDWLDAKTFPEWKFESTSVKLTGPDTADVTGNLTMHGKTAPVTLQAKFNGGYPGMPTYDPQARVGFSAKGVLKRSDFGVSMGIPAPGSKMGVSDDVEIIIEAEFNGPPLAAAAAPAAPAP